MAPEPAPQSADELESTVDQETVARRADGRPDEERSSDDPEAQAKAILEESEDRTAERFHAAAPLEEDPA